MTPIAIGVGISPVLLGMGGQTYSGRILATNPIAYWPLNETTGTAAVCPVNAAMNGTYNRDVSLMGTGTISRLFASAERSSGQRPRSICVARVVPW